MYNSLTGGITANLVTFSLDPGQLWGSTGIPQKTSLPSLPQIDLGFGNLIGQFNRVGLASGNLTNLTPGTTDQVLIDLRSLTDPVNLIFTDLAKVVAVLVLNDATTDGYNLTVGAAAANAWTAPFGGSTTATVICLAGYVAPTDGKNRFGSLLLSGGNTSCYAVGTSSNHILKLASGSATALPYRVVVFGRDA
jgi:hypothetical protein